MKNKFCKATALLMATIFTIPSFATKDIPNIQKEEIIYVSTQIDGKINDSYVVNIFDLQEDATITDFGKYKNIQNLTNLDELNYENEKIEISAQKGKFFYQGNSLKKELPWNIKIEFIKNNKILSPQEVVGEKGLITIRGYVKPNLYADEIFTNYYLGQLSIEIDSINASVISSENSTKAYQGSVQILNYTILPEKELNFEIIVDSKNFEMKPFKFSAIPFNMNFEMPDTNSLTNNLKELESAISQINMGTNSLSGGMTQIYDNTKLLINSLEEINIGLSAVNNGNKELIDGTNKFHDGLNKYSNGINQMVDKMSEMENGMNKLSNGLNELQKGSYDLSNGIILYKDGLHKYTDAITKIHDGQSKFTDGIQELSTNGNKLKEGGKKLVDASTQIYDALAFLDNISFLKELNEENLNKIKIAIDKILLFWDETEKNINKIDFEQEINNLLDAKNTLENIKYNLEQIYNRLDINHLTQKLSLDTQNEDVSKLLSEIQEIQNQILEINQKVETINLQIQSQENLQKILSQLKQNKEEIKIKLQPLREMLENYESKNNLELIKQLTSFRSNYYLFHSGLIEYTNGTNLLLDSITTQIVPASKEINFGLNEIDNSSNKLTTNLDKILVGSIQITNGLSLIVSELATPDFSEVSKLKTGMDMIVENHSLIIEGQKKLDNGFTQISEGLNKYLNGFSLYKNGVKDIKNGTNKLSDGTALLENKTNGMSYKAKSQIDEAMKAFKKDGFTLKSFVDDKNENIKLVQFVYVSEELISHTQKEEQKIQTKTTWEKIMDIIIFWK